MAEIGVTPNVQSLISVILRSPIEFLRFSIDSESPKLSKMVVYRIQILIVFENCGPKLWYASTGCCVKRTACSLFRWSIYNSRAARERAVCVRRNGMRRGRRRDNCESTLAHSDSHTLPHWLSQSWPPLFTFTSGISPRHPCLAEFGSTFGYFWINRE